MNLFVNEWVINYTLVNVQAHVLTFPDLINDSMMM